MAQNLQLDPTKRDYITVNGSPIPSDRMEEASYYALLIPQGGWLYGNPGQGSLIYTLEGQKHNSSTEQKFAAYANDAIQRQLISTGKATAVNTHNLQTTPTGTSNQVQVVPAATQLSDQLNFIPV